MSRKKIGHHWLSEAYLNNFTDSNSQIWVLTPENRIYSTSPHNICKERHYNTIDGSLIIEDSLSNIEGVVFPIINNKVKNRKDISQEEKLLLAYYISIVFCRVKNRRESLRESYKDLIHWADEWKTDERSQVFSSPMNDNHKTYSIDDLRETLKNFNQRFAVSSMNSSEHSLDYIANMKWVFFTAPKNSFISSDDPVRLCRPEAEKRYGPFAIGSRAGLRHKDVELTFPITSDTLLGASWKIKTDLIYTPMLDRKIFGINCRTMRHARNLFATNKQILEYILEEDKKLTQNK